MSNQPADAALNTSEIVLEHQVVEKFSALLSSLDDESFSLSVSATSRMEDWEVIDKRMMKCQGLLSSIHGQCYDWKNNGCFAISNENIQKMAQCYVDALNAQMYHKRRRINSMKLQEIAAQIDKI